MKASLRTKVLVLSLSALVIVGSGCERRGRAPVKSSGSGPSSLAADPNQKSTPIVPGTETPVVDRETDLSKSKESDLETDARMECNVAAIDELATPTRESFTADLALVNDFWRCIAQHGIVLQDRAEGDQEWAFDSSSDPKKPSAAYSEFIKISHEADSNDDVASKVMTSRLELSIRRLGKMIAKYGDEKLPSSEVVKDSFQKEISVGKTLDGIKKAISALESGRENIKNMKTIVDGADITLVEEESTSDEA